MDIDIVYTAHAEKRLEERFISKQDVETGVHKRKWEAGEGDRRKVVHSINGKKIKVVFEHKDNKVTVITVHWIYQI